MLVLKGSMGPVGILFSRVLADGKIIKEAVGRLEECSLSLQYKNERPSKTFIKCKSAQSGFVKSI